MIVTSSKRDLTSSCNYDIDEAAPPAEEPSLIVDVASSLRAQESPDQAPHWAH